VSSKYVVYAFAGSEFACRTFLVRLCASLDKADAVLHKRS
jgi:hypothetical protein